MSELRECPFCGGALRIAAKRWFRSHCPTCHMIGPMPNHPAMPTRESAIRASNTRPADAVREAAREVWESVPSSYDENDPMVQRHARALNALGAALAQDGRG